MTEENPTLAEFLLGRIEEDEAEAQAASPGPWRTSAEQDEVLAVDGILVCDGFALSGPQTRATTRHIALHDPVRVLAECAAKRAIVDQCRDRYAIAYRESERLLASAFNQEAVHLEGSRGPIWPHKGAEMILHALASAYSDHPDFDPGWAS